MSYSQLKPITPSSKYESCYDALASLLPVDGFLRTLGRATVDEYWASLREKIYTGSPHVQGHLNGAIKLLEMDGADLNVMAVISAFVLRASVLAPFAENVIVTFVEQGRPDPVSLIGTLNFLANSDPLLVAIASPHIGDDLRLVGAENNEDLARKVLTEWRAMFIDPYGHRAYFPNSVRIHDQTLRILKLLDLCDSKKLSYASKWIVLLAYAGETQYSVEIQSVLREISFPIPDYKKLIQCYREKMDEIAGTRLCLNAIGVEYINRFLSDINVIHAMSSLPTNSDSVNARIDEYCVADRTFYIPYFLSIGSVVVLRPRRFGKTFWLSTLEDFFLHPDAFTEDRLISEISFRVGNFTWNPRGLSVDYACRQRWRHNFPSCPVLRIDLALLGDVTDINSLRSRLNSLMNCLGREHSVVFAPGLDWSLKLRSIITTLATGSKYGKIVVLIDEYDSVMMSLCDDSLFNDARGLFRVLFLELAELRDLILLQVVTGISRWALTDVFSEACNMFDMTFDHNTSCLFGFTEAELTHVLKSHKLAEGMARQIIQNSGAYSFDILNPLNKVHNPFFVQQCLISGGDPNGDYWVNSAPPLTTKYSRELSSVQLPARLTFNDLVNANPYSSIGFLGVLVHLGYATIASVRSDSNEGRLIEISAPNANIGKCLVEGVHSNFVKADLLSTCSEYKSNVSNASFLTPRVRKVTAKKSKAVRTT